MWTGPKLTLILYDSTGTTGTSKVTTDFVKDVKGGLSEARGVSKWAEGAQWVCQDSAIGTCQKGTKWHCEKCRKKGDYKNRIKKGEMSLSNGAIEVVKTVGNGLPKWD